jgi:hypothetical protein
MKLRSKRDRQSPIQVAKAPQQACNYTDRDKAFYLL